jgi:hypothetical protein
VKLGKSISEVVAPSWEAYGTVCEEIKSECYNSLGRVEGK